MSQLPKGQGMHVKLHCSVCQEEFESKDLYWKGAAYCEHGVPTVAIPVCLKCLNDVELNVQGETYVVYCLIYQNSDITTLQ